MERFHAPAGYLKPLLTLFQYNFKTEYMINYGLTFATILMSMLPILIFYAFMQKYIISGLTSGAVKS